MDVWSLLLLLALMTGIMGWGMNVYVNAVYWYCEWREGNDINWGLDTAFMVAVPFAWMFAILEIVLLYCK